MPEKLYGWVVAKVLNFDSKTIEFHIEESEFKNGYPKFPQLLNRAFVYHRKKKIWNANIVRDDEYSVHFVSTNVEFVPEQGRQYVLLINTTDFTPIEIWKVGTMAAFCKIFARPYLEPLSQIMVDEKVYLANIALIQGSVKGTLREICAKLVDKFGRSRVYLEHQNTDWYIRRSDGSFDETAMPELPKGLI